MRKLTILPTLRNYKSVEEMKSSFNAFRKKLNKWWNLFTVLAGFMAFSFSLNGLAKNTAMPIYLILIQAAITGGIIAFIFKAFERVPNVIIEEVERRSEAQIKKDLKPTETKEDVKS